MRPKDAATAAAPQRPDPRVNPGRLRRVTLAILPSQLLAPGPRCSRPGSSGPARRRRALEVRRESCNNPAEGSRQRLRRVSVDVVSDATGGGVSRGKTFGERVIYDKPWGWLGQGGGGRADGVGAAGVGGGADRGRGDLELRHAGRVAAAADAAGLGSFGDPPGQVADAAALAGGAGELGEFPGFLEVVFGFVVLAADMQGGGQVAAQASLGAGEAVIHGSQGGAEVVGGLRVAEGDQAVAAPAGQVRLVQREIRQVLAGGTVADLPGGAVEGVTAGRRLPRRWRHLCFGAAHPA